LQQEIVALAAKLAMARQRLPAATAAPTSSSPRTAAGAQLAVVIVVLTAMLLAGSHRPAPRTATT
jgi:hypothetical protein